MKRTKMSTFYRREVATHTEGATMTQHTAGPWTLSAGRTFTTSDGEFYLTYGKDRHDNPKFKNFCALDANARLIAASPDLLKVLKELLWYVDHSNLDGGSYTKTARLVIAQAEGRN